MIGDLSKMGCDRLQPTTLMRISGREWMDRLALQIVKIKYILEATNKPRVHKEHYGKVADELCVLCGISSAKIKTIQNKTEGSL